MVLRAIEEIYFQQNLQKFNKKGNQLWKSKGKKIGKRVTSMRKLNTLLNKQWVKEEFKIETRKYFEMSENENTKYQNI